MAVKERATFRIADVIERVKIQGAMREVCRVDGTSIFGVERCVAKAYTRETREWLWSNQGVGDGVYFSDVHAHHVAGKYAADFNAKAPGVRVEVVPAVVVEVLEVTNSDQDAEFTLGSDRRYLHIEPFIEGVKEEFTKFNSNTFDASLLLSDRHADPIAEAYSHFTWAASSGKLVVSDVQGVRNGSTLMVTDPQIHTSDRRTPSARATARAKRTFAPSSPRTSAAASARRSAVPPVPRRREEGPRDRVLGFSLRPFFTRQDCFRRAAASSKFGKTRLSNAGTPSPRPVVSFRAGTNNKPNVPNKGGSSAAGRARPKNLTGKAQRSPRTPPSVFAISLITFSRASPSKLARRRETHPRPTADRASLIVATSSRGRKSKHASTSVAFVFAVSMNSDQSTL